MWFRVLKIFYVVTYEAISRGTALYFVNLVQMKKKLNGSCNFEGLTRQVRERACVCVCVCVCVQWLRTTAWNAKVVLLVPTSSGIY
jgi:hypothetical protein